MKFIREYRTMIEGVYIRQFEIAGICTDNNPESFYLIRTSEGYVSINETEFPALWKCVAKYEMETEIKTTFQYTRMERAKKGIFTLILSEIPESDITSFVLTYGEYINRDYP